MHILLEHVGGANHSTHFELDTAAARFGACHFCTTTMKQLQSTVQKLQEGLSMVCLHCLYKQALAQLKAQAVGKGTKVKTLFLTAVGVLSGDHHEVQRRCQTCHPLPH